MAKRKRKDKKEFEESSHIKTETLQSVLAIVFFLISIFLLLSVFKKAGPAGEFVVQILMPLLGWGYFILPAILSALGLAFLLSIRKNIATTQSLGALIFLTAGLGLVALILPDKGGSIGRLIVSPIVKLFDQFLTAIILLALIVISALVMFDAPLKFQVFRDLYNRLFKKKEEQTLSQNELEKINELRASAPREIDEKTEALKLVKAAAAEKNKKKISEDLGINLNKVSASGLVYNPPPLSILSRDSGKPEVGDIKANANIIKRTLQNFGISVEMDEITIGPTVTRYALKPAEGVKLSKIVGLQNDLSLALAAHPLRIEAPIPGKSLVGIEIPNSVKTTVGLGSIISQGDFQNSPKPLLVALGKAISGESFYDDLSKMPHLLVAGATGSGKTCAKDTYIFSEKGVLTFEELCPLPLETETNYTLRVATRDGIEATSKNYNNGICEFYKITTEEGLSIEVTAEHPLWGIKDGVMTWRSGGSLEIGEYVAISRGAKLFGVNKDIEFTPLIDKIKKARKIKIPKQMTKELALFLGLLAADGGLTVKNRIVYTQANKEVLNIYISLLKKLFGIKASHIAKSGKSNKARDVVCYSKQLKDFLLHIGVKPVRAQEKEIPISIRESDAETIQAFIRGFVRNDGHVSPRTGLEITLANKKFLKQLQVILLNFGIISNLHLKNVKGYENNEYWRLTVNGGEFVRYVKEINFLTEEERRKAEKLTRLSRNPNRDIIPVLSPILKKLSDSYRMMFARLTNKGWVYSKNIPIPKYAFANLKSYNNGDRNPSYNALEKILDFYKPLSNSTEHIELSKINRDKFYWARISKIERTKGEGYDFEVPGSHSFLGNGFVNHNSVAIHAIIASLLYRNSPENLKFMMIDPKRVELTLYNKIPHLLTPVLTDPKKAILALKWAAKEMDRRYDILEAEKVRDISSYHKNIVEPALKNKKNTSETAELPEALPYIVVIIDELADIMSMYPRELEAAIVRLAQMSRAVGIHLILSTQRPSVNVITGLIKANIPARMALQVASQVDSRTILDMSGAEKLLGAGDMLFISSDMAKPQRIQTAYIAESEAKAIVKYLVENYSGNSEDQVSLDLQSASQAIEIAGSEDEDELYEEARELVIAAGKASTSYLQRRLKVGYARAARLIDILEERGVVGPGEGSKPREIIGGSFERVSVEAVEKPPETS